MENLYKLASEHGVMIESWPLKNPLDAVYIKEPGLPPVIAISSTISETSAKYKTLLAHELGHHFTSAGDALPSRFYSYGETLCAARFEYRAHKWAAEYLMPLDKLVDAFNAGLRETWELAEHFGVTEDLIEFRLAVLWCSV